MKKNTLFNKFTLVLASIKRPAICLFLITLGTSAYSQNGLEKIIVEKIRVTPEAVESDDSLSENAISYRVFVDMAPEYEMQLVNPSPYHELIFETTTKFYNNADFGGTNSGEIIDAFITDAPALAFDSYITINGATKNKVGLLMKEDTTDGKQDGLFTKSYLPLITIGDDFSIPFGTDNYAGKFSTNEGIYNVLGGEKGPSASNRVLIGQFTTDGIFSFELNIQIRTFDTNKVLNRIDAIVETYFAKNPLNEQEYLFPDLIYTSGPHVSINIANPVNNANVPLNDTVSIEVNTTGIISMVEFYADSIKIGEDTTAPYQINWAPKSVGSSEIFAIATDKDDMLTNSTAISVNISDEVGIINNENNVSFIIYPNPVKNHLTMKINGCSIHSDYQLMITDLVGKALMSKNITVTDNYTEDIDVSQLSHGVYIIKAMDSNGNETIKRFIKE